MKRTFMLTLLMIVCALAATTGVAPSAAAQPATPGDPMVFAHYYIWFEATSWNRAKIDYPAAGRYTSDQESIMREHVRTAMSIGIDGFIVSWKSTEVLDPRLEQLIGIAEEEDFKLAITYQGLDFNRDPLPAARVSDDLDVFIERYASSSVFDAFGRPVVIWSGTWEYSAEEIEFTTSGRRDDLAILASEKNVEGFNRIADSVDGNMYYWSSVNPDTYPGYPDKLIEMANAVRESDGLWIAPVAPGFDAKEVGGTTLVDRAGGHVLRREWEGAIASVPDAIGIISWNEFSENTHIEPSLLHGDDAIRVVADLTGSPMPSAVDFDSSAPQGPPAQDLSGAIRFGMIAAFFMLILVSGLVVRRRNLTRYEPVHQLPAEPPPPERAASGAPALDEPPK